jgi:hypothetical protein
VIPVETNSATREIGGIKKSSGEGEFKFAIFDTF